MEVDVRNKIGELLVILANNISSKQGRDVHYDRIKEDETNSCTQR